MLQDIADSQRSLRGIFIGSALCFSDIAIKLANEEITCITFQRLPTLADLSALDDAAAAEVRLIVVYEGMLDDLQVAIPSLKQKFPQAFMALAYRNRAAALRLIREACDHPCSRDVGFLPMGVEMDCWLSVLRLLVWGERYVPANLIDNAREAPAPATPSTPNGQDRSHNAQQEVHLTAREREVLRAAAAGKPNKIIAEDLSLSQHTVKLHMHHIIAKLGVSNRTEATLWYLSQSQHASGRSS
ncbi:helix-turn-helix transcriptional regulator [Roseovarius sp. D0-M9]|uniref:helix-turn-helix transcriptional regulator n=1 Tax=Roseovarius sp. D0-M9 TaxID=3127117 RepID=UPI00301034AE